MKKQPSLSQEEASQFRDAVKDAQRLPTHNRRAQARKPPSARPLQAELDARDVITHLLDHPLEPEMFDTGDALEFRQPGVQLAVLRKLRRGQFARQAELDLHGLTASQAREQVVHFLTEARRRDLRCVRIIHGKGMRSNARGPVLKPKLASWLRQRQEVLAYCSAQLTEGGTGAVYVLLRNR